MKWLLPALMLCAMLNVQAGARAEARTPLEPFVLDRYQGEAVDIRNYQGKVVMVNFWATWCPPCLEEFPSMIELRDTMEGEPFELLAVNMGEDRETIEGFMFSLDSDVNFPILVDQAETTVAERWQLRVLPTTVIVDKQGKRAHTIIGSKDWNSADNRALLNPLLRE